MQETTEITQVNPQATKPIKRSHPAELARKPDVQEFKDAFRTDCPGCPAKLMLRMPFVHCPACHNRWRAKRLAYPKVCPACRFDLFSWRGKNGIQELNAEAALIA